ncbi:MAG TPA: DUF4159 domain-containing protein [Kiloniellales bacterium]|nr:DUF4159 domain-containing protein [Kiloniellales bacterium]
MTTIGPLAFLEPWILAALALLPVIWWLLRATPPAPKRQGFPAIRLLLGLKAQEETPERTPWWLLLLRLFIAALIIVALARPILDPREELPGSGPLLVVIDDGWAAAAGWDDHKSSLDQYLAEAERKGESLRLLLTAPNADDSPPTVSEVMTATQARARVQGLEPKAWPVDRAAAREALAALDPGEDWRVLWMADGVEDTEGSDAADFGAALAALGPVMRLVEPTGAKLLRPPENASDGVVVTVERAEERGEDLGIVVALRDDGREVARLPVTFADGETAASGSLELPIELANAIGRLVLEGKPTAGGVYLLDENSRRRPVGLLSSGAEDEQPLFSELYYVERALAPFAEIQRGPLEQLMAQPLAVLVLPDESVLSAEERDRITAFLEEGGLVLRFAGPKLAANPDELLPVQLRGGGRTMGGIMTWDQPAPIAPFTPPSPYAGLLIPQDVVVNQQVLAEPSLDLADKTWAKLVDGTPLVTAERRGDGLLVLFHTTANDAWSNLAFSGLFVEMLVRTVEAARGVAGLGEGEALPPQQMLDGFGRLVEPTPTVLSLNAETLESGAVGPTHPPGYYGSDSGRRAFNLESAVETLSPLPQVTGVADRGYARAAEVELKAPLLAGALVLALCDLLLSLFLRGLIPTRRAARGAAGALLVAVVLTQPWGSAEAQDARDSFALLATLETRLAYVETGDDEVDEISRAGLNGLTLALTRRTSVEPAEPLGVNLASDEIVFFPLLYWPITAAQPSLDQATRDKVNRFLATGGSILFDLRDPAMTGFSDASVDLQRLTEGLDVPPLEPVPPEHVLTKAFYLLQDFPGRYAGGELWVDAAGSTANDGVASIIIGSNDWGAAWAIGSNGMPLYAVVPEGERQREMSYRFGINLVMYVLTGNYKADQVHVPFILERLGQ